MPEHCLFKAGMYFLYTGKQLITLNNFYEKHFVHPRRDPGNRLAAGRIRLQRNWTHPHPAGTGRCIYPAVTHPERRVTALLPFPKIILCEYL